MALGEPAGNDGIVTGVLEAVVAADRWGGVGADSVADEASARRLSRRRGGADVGFLTLPGRRWSVWVVCCGAGRGRVRSVEGPWPAG